MPEKPGKANERDRRGAPLLGTVVGTNEKGEPLIKVHLTSEQRKLLGYIKAKIESLPDDEQEQA